MLRQPAVADPRLAKRDHACSGQSVNRGIIRTTHGQGSSLAMAGGPNTGGGLLSENFVYIIRKGLVRLLETSVDLAAAPEVSLKLYVDVSNPVKYIGLLPAPERYDSNLIIRRYTPL